VVVSPESIPALYHQVQQEIAGPFVSPTQNHDVVRIRRRAFVPPFALGDSKYTIPGCLTTSSLSVLSRMPAGAERSSAQELSALRSRIERRIREFKVWTASSATFRSSNNLWHADVVTCCMLLSEWLHFLRKHNDDEL
jgi:hypothetical protein